VVPDKEKLNHDCGFGDRKQQVKDRFSWSG
jgi:hypothetical protein